MATQTLAAADAILKDYYVGPIVEQLNQKTYLLDQIERDSDHIDLTGRRAIVPVHKNRNRGRASIADGGTLPSAGKQEWLDAIIKIRYHQYGIEVSDASIKATQSNEGAFISLLEAESKGVAVDMRKDINRQAFGEGNGVLGVCKEVDETKKIVTMRSAYDVQYIQIGDVIDILVASSGATTNGIVKTEVTARSVANHTITIAGETAGALAETYSVYISGNRSNEMDGLRNIASKGRTLHEINSSTAGNAFWDAVVKEAGESLSATAVAGESLFQQLADDVGAHGNGDVEVFLTTRGIRRRLAAEYQSQKRYNDAQAVDVHGGYSAIMVNEIPVVSDDDCPKTSVFGFNKSALKWFEQTKPGWLQMEDGKIFHLKVAGTGSYSANWQAWFCWYAALGAAAANRTGKILYCTDDNPIEGSP